MTKEQYITQLKKYLRRLPKQDYDDAIEYFEEYFGEADEAGQQKLMEELGTPKEAARDLISNLLDKKLDDKSSFEKPVRKGTLRIALLAICAAPVAIPMLVALFAILLSVAICMFAVYLSIFAVALSTLLIGAKLFVRGIIAILFLFPEVSLFLDSGCLVSEPAFCCASLEFICASGPASCS